VRSVVDCVLASVAIRASWEGGGDWSKGGDDSRSGSAWEGTLGLERGECAERRSFAGATFGNGRARVTLRNAFS